eukprot:2585030-Amphidinium_carterae.1
MSGLRICVVQDNRFAGSLPERGVMGMGNVARLEIQVNGFTARLPDGLRGLAALIFFDLGVNKFAGALPQRGLMGMPKVSTLKGAYNPFVGPLPEGGLRALTALRVLHLWENHFISGTLPEGGLSGML